MNKNPASLIQAIWPPGGALTFLLLSVAFSSGCTSFVPARSTLGPQPVVVPLQFDKDRGQPFVEVWINGQGPHRFLLDTGTHAVMVDQALASQLRLEETRTRHVSLDPDQRRVPAPAVVFIDSLKLHGAEFYRFEAVLHDFSTREYVGVLGNSPLLPYLVTLDLARKRFILEDRRPLSSSQPQFSMASGRHSPTIPVIVGLDSSGHSVHQLAVDTGNNIGLVLPLEVKHRFPDLKPVASRRVWTFAGESEVHFYRLPAEVSLGQYSIRDPYVTFVKGQGMVGTGILSDFTVILDLEARRIQLVKNE